MLRLEAASLLLLSLALPGCSTRNPAIVSDGAGAVGDSRSSPSPDGGRVAVPDRSRSPDGMVWRCETKEGRTLCRTATGLPDGSGWRCHLGRTTALWVCFGQASAHPGTAWSCRFETAVNLWRCTKPNGPDDRPGGDGHWVCWRSSRAGGTVCEDALPAPERCRAGQRQWCDNLAYDGWGQVECDPQTLRWKKTPGGDLACVFGPYDQGPDTLCTCYHFFYSPECCERVDCIVLEENRPPAVCPTPPGGLCSYCFPQKNECKEPGAQCVVSGNSENFCSRPCGASSPCPAGFDCMAVKMQWTTTQQCVPGDFSCYN